jgi:hypothetical protein
MREQVGGGGSTGPGHYPQRKASPENLSGSPSPPNDLPTSGFLDLTTLPTMPIYCPLSIVFLRNPVVQSPLVRDKGMRIQDLAS